MLVLHDLTEMRRLEAVRRDFVANVSHELKTPLTSISGYAETLLGDTPDPETTRRFLATILSNAQRMQRLVDDLLDLSRIESGRWQPSRTDVDVAAVARESWAALAGPGGDAAASSWCSTSAPDAATVDADLDAAPPDPHQPHGQLAPLHAARRPHHLPAAGGWRRRRGEHPRQRRRASRASICLASSSGSTAPTRPARARRAAPA